MSVDNPFRKEYRKLEPEELARVDRIKSLAELLLKEIIGNVPADHRGYGVGREQSIAITKLEESVMWAVKGVTE